MREQEYVLRQVCDERHRELDRRLSVIEEGMNAIEAKIDRLLLEGQFEKIAAWVVRGGIVILLAMLGANANISL